MKNIIKSILIFFILIFLHYCSNENNPIQPEISEEDLHFKNMLLGKWQFNDIIVRHFNNDGTFFDSTYSSAYTRDPIANPITICTEPDSNGIFLDRVVYGKYEIKNGVMKLQPIDYLIDCNPGGNQTGHPYFNNFIEITNDTLRLITIFNWKRTDNSLNNIWGSWETSYWSWAYDKDLPPGGAAQLIKHSITFYSDSTIFHQKIVGLPYFGILERIPYTYVPPMLYVIPGNEKYYVLFDKDMMQWLDTKPTFKYTRK